MRKQINGKIYDTEKSKLLFECSQRNIKIYRKKTKEIFGASDNKIFVIEDTSYFDTWSIEHQNIVKRLNANTHIEYNKAIVILFPKPLLKRAEEIISSTGESFSEFVLNQMRTACM